jgi:glycosyltransferase involved in cell wall biosynthesis
MSRIGVMHVTDALDPGGLERVAVNLVNLLPRDRYVLHLCTTRRDGPLDALVAPDVCRLRLQRQHRLDLRALRQLRQYLLEHEIQILHAHGTSLFISAAVSLLAKRWQVIWHDHFGRSAVAERPAWLYGLAVSRASGVVAVNQPLAEWSRARLGVPAERVWYVPNFVCAPDSHSEVPLLPGVPGARIACVANLRPQKDHLSLLRAMAPVVRAVPDAHLLLIGSASDAAHTRRLNAEIARLSIGSHVTILGYRDDVPGVLRACDVGVLSSESEGLPLALIEYGMAGLAAVATRVGQCAEVLDNGRAGRLVPPGAPEALAAALIELLTLPIVRQRLRQRLRQHVQDRYTPETGLREICRIYDTVARVA